MQGLKFSLFFLLLSLSVQAKDNSDPTWPSDQKYEAIQRWLSPKPRKLLRIQPRIAEWSIAKMEAFHRGLQEDGFRSPHYALLRNPRLATMGVARRRESIGFLRYVLGIQPHRIFAEPLVIGHFLPVANDFYSEFSPQDRASFHRLSDTAKILVLKAIRAVDFNIPDTGLNGKFYILKTAYFHRCTDWVRAAANFTARTAHTAQARD